jgi:hypothetical protein
LWFLKNLITTFKKQERKKQSMERLRKIFIVSVLMMTVFSMSVLVAPVASAATAQAGDLIKQDAYSSVYYLGADNKRYVFPNQNTYFSWYSDFSGVKTVSQSELESYPLGKNVTIRPGTYLIKIQSDPKVYAVEPGGELVWVPSEAVAKALYGDDWAKMVVDVPDSFFTNYTMTSREAKSDEYPAGSLIKMSDSSDVYYIDEDGKARKVANEGAFLSNLFQWGFIVTTDDGFSLPTAGTDVDSQESDLVDLTAGAGGTINAGTGLTAALASDTPASATVIVNTTQNAQAMVPFTKVNFTASSDGDVKVTSLKYKRSGISSDTSLDGLYLYDGETRLTDITSVTSSYVIFNNANGLFTVPSGETKAITLKGDMNRGAGSANTIGFNLEEASNVITNGASVSGSFPMSGNLMNVATVTDLGRVSFTGNTVPTADNTSISPSESEQEVWKVTLQGNEQELAVEKLIFTAVGSIQNEDLVDFNLYANSAVVATVEGGLNDDNEVIFDMKDDPLMISKGSSKNLSLRAIIEDGSTKEFYFSFQNPTDVVVRDTNYDVYVEPYTSAWSIVKPTGDYQIASGSLSITRSTDSPTEDVVVDGTNVTLGIWDFRASGEDIKVKNMDILADTSSYGGIDNGKIYQDDVQVGTTKDLTEDTDVNFTFGSTFVVKAGETSKVKVVGDVKTTTSTSYSGGETVTISIGTGSSNAQRVTSLGTFNAPSSDTAANQLTITAAALTINKYSGFGDQTIVAGTNDAKVGSFVLTAGAAGGVDVSSVTVALSAAEAATISRMYLKDNSTGDVIGDEKNSPSTSNIINFSLNIPASGTKVIDLYADVKSGANAGSWIANIDADGTAENTGNAVSATAANIQTMTIGSGTIYAANGSHPANNILLAGTTGNKVAEFIFSSANEAFTVEKLKLTVGNNFATSTAGVKLKYTDEDGDARETSVTPIITGTEANATATFTGLDIYVPVNDETLVEVYTDLTSVASGAVSGANTAFTFDYNEGFRAVGTSGSVSTSVGSANLSGNTFYVRKSRPTFAKQTISDNAATGKLYRFTVSSDSAGTTEIKQLGFTVSTSGVTVSNMYLYDVDNSEQLTTTPLDADSSGYVKVLVGAVDDTVMTVGTQTRTMELRGTVTGWGDTGDSLTVSFKKDTSAAANAAANTINGSHYNTWSDRSAANHSTTTTDWTNGYLIKNMDDTQSFTP